MAAKKPAATTPEDMQPEVTAPETEAVQKPEEQAEAAGTVSIKVIEDYDSIVDHKTHRVGETIDNVLTERAEYLVSRKLVEII